MPSCVQQPGASSVTVNAAANFTVFESGMHSSPLAFFMAVTQPRQLRADHCLLACHPPPCLRSAGEDSKDDASKPAAALQLSQEQLSEFGGVRQVVAHLKAAPTSEACRNLLAVLLDHVAHQLTNQVNFHACV